MQKNMAFWFVLVLVFAAGILAIPSVFGISIISLDIAVKANIMENAASPSALQICNSTIAVFTEKGQYMQKEKISYALIIDEETKNEKNFKITYWIEDLEHNIVRKAVATTSLKNKSYTPSIKSREKQLKIIAELESCGIFRAEKLINVINPNGTDEANKTKNDGGADKKKEKNTAGKEKNSKEEKDKAKAGENDDSALNENLVRSVQDKSIALKNAKSSSIVNISSKNATEQSTDFRSSTARIKDLIMYFLIIAFGCVLIALMWRE